MVYTEIKKRNKKNYFYRVLSIRKGDKIVKERIYLGANLSNNELVKEIVIADKKFISSIENETIIKLKPQIIKILKKNKILRAGIFGSYATNKQKKDSDIDLVIEPCKGTGMNLIRIQLELQDKLNKKVDLVTYKSLHPLIKKNILDEEVRIL